MGQAGPRRRPLPPIAYSQRGRSILRTSHWQISANFAFWAFSEADIPALCVAPSLCGRHSYVEITGSWSCLHKTLSGAGMEQSELRIDGVLRSSPSDANLPPACFIYLRHLCG